MENITEIEKKKKIRKRILTIFFVLLNIGIIVLIAFLEFGKNEDEKANWQDIHLQFGFLILGILCFTVALIAESFKYTSMLRTYGYYKNSKTNGLSTAVLGKYFDNITPAGAGGQPFQIFHLKQCGCSDGVAGLFPICGFLGLQFAFIIIAIFCLIFGAKFVSDLVAIRITAIVGLCFYAFVPILIILFSIFPKTLKRAIIGIFNFLHKIHLMKDPTKTTKRTLKALNSYTSCIKQLLEKPWLIVKIMVYSLIFQLAVLSMPYFVLHAFGSTIGFFECFCRVSYIYCAITIIFTPGNSGAAEASFYMVFKDLDTGYIFWAMLIWRLLCYYSWLIAGLIYYLVHFLQNKRIAKMKEQEGDPVTLYFIDTYYPHIDGVVRTIDAYASRIKNSCVVYPNSGGELHGNYNYEMIQLPSMHIPGAPYRLPLPMFSRKLEKYVKTHNIKVIHSHSPFFIGRTALKIGRRYGIPVITTFHSKYYDDFYNTLHSKILSKFLIQHFVLPYYNRCDYVWTCSNSTAETLREYGYKGDIFVMENGTDMQYPENAQELKDIAIKLYNIPKEKPMILYVGQIIWHKNLKLILDTCAELTKRGFEYTMLFVGEGYHEVEIKRYAKTLQFDDLRFVNSIDNKDLLKGLYLRADLLFFPSVYDNAPLVLREAASLKTPALLTRGANAAEKVIDEENGYLEEQDPIKMADKIQRIFSDDKHYNIGVKASETIPQTWDEITRQVEEKYRTTYGY